MPEIGRCGGMKRTEEIIFSLFSREDNPISVFLLLGNVSISLILMGLNSNELSHCIRVLAASIICNSVVVELLNAVNRKFGKKIE